MSTEKSPGETPHPPYPTRDILLEGTLLTSDEQEKLTTATDEYEYMDANGQREAFIQATAARLVLERALTEAVEERDTDYQTGLFTRRAWDQHLKDRISDYEVKGSQFGVMLIDINYLKEINDIYGHHYGDNLIQSLGKVLREGTRMTSDPLLEEEDFAARLGGDEFGLAVDLSEFANKYERELFLQTLADRISRGYGQEIADETSLNPKRYSISYGYEIYDPSFSPNQLMQSADQQLRGHKSRQHAQHGESR